MKADFSRTTFDRSKHYRRVLEQQGRVAIDAEPNEQVAIDAALAETTAYDVIGPSGVPEALLPDGTPSGGFLLGLNPAGTDITISKGRMYVEGVLVQNDADDVTLLTQSDAPLEGLKPAALGLDKRGFYAAYLDVWERLIDTINAPLLRETAIGGPDGALRSKTVWQLKLWPLPEAHDNPTCASSGEPWRHTKGTLTASVGAPAVDPLPCILPPATGFRRLENQLYRVEVHAAGGYGTLAFKWSRENGSVIAAVVGLGSVPATTPITGPTFHVGSVGRDASLGFEKGDWVELIDDVAELVEGHGELLEVDSVDPAEMTITTKTTPVRAVLSAQHPKLRRWEQRGASLGGGVVVPDGTPIPLEDGVQVAFGPGPFQVGDYWTIPARVQLTPSGGTIEWPQDAAGNFLPQPPRGVVHHYAKLAVLSFDGEKFTVVEDCRKLFPPLTSVAVPPATVNPCTLVLAPGPGWEKPLAKLLPNPPVKVDAELCFPVGDFPVTAPVVIATLGGHVKVSGAGWGTHLHTERAETVLRFEGCASVTIRDLTLDAGSVGDVTKNINGALECIDCDDVDVERIAASCASGPDGAKRVPERSAACVAVRSTIDAANAATGKGTVRIRSSRLRAGDMQVGILLIHQRRIMVEDNDIGVTTRSALKLADILREPSHLKSLQKMLIAHADIGTPVAPAAPVAPALPAPVAAGKRAPLAIRALPPNATIKVGDRAVAFRTPQAFANVWQTYLDQNAPKEFASNADLLRFTKTAALKLLTDPVTRDPFGEFKGLARQVEANTAAVGSRGIAVGGQAYSDVRALNNTIDGFLIGISVGVSHRETKAGPPPSGSDPGGSVTVADNDIRVAVNVLTRGARHAVFVGNANSIHIARNVARYDPGSLPTIPHSDAIRVFGYVGKRLIVRDNHLIDFTSGVVVHGLSGPGKEIFERDDTAADGRKGKVWLVHDNVCENATAAVVAVACDHANNVF